MKMQTATALVVVAAFLLASPSMVLSEQYIVGDIGWGLQEVDYNAWAASKTFYAGDVLIFHYDSIYHNVVVATDSDAFDNCVSNPNLANCLHLLPLWNGTDRLTLFRANLREEGSFDEAVKGCDGVFHVAASMQFGVPVEENIEGYVQSDIIDLAIKGTLDLLKSCVKSGTVSRIVVTSSRSTMTAKDSNGNPISVVDESCKTHWDAKASGWVYALSKILTEEAAFRFSNENGIKLVSVITSTVGGPFLTSSVPSSIQVLLSPLTGNSELYGILSAVTARMGSIALVHIEDICNAHVFVMEHEEAEGRYICAEQSCSMSELVLYLAQAYPSSNSNRVVVEEEQNNPIPYEISSKKLRDLGFKYKHGIEDINYQSVSSCLNLDLLPQK